MVTSHDLATLREELERTGYSKENEYIYRREWEARQVRRTGPKRRPMIRDGQPPASKQGFLDRLAEFFSVRLNRSDSEWRP